MGWFGWLGGEGQGALRRHELPPRAGGRRTREQAPHDLEGDEREEGEDPPEDGRCEEHRPEEAAVCRVDEPLLLRPREGHTHTHR